MGTLTHRRPTPMHLPANPRSPDMKAILPRWILALAALAALAAAGRAQTINWGSEAFSTLLGSNGSAIPQAGYTFELGVFDDDPAFIPTKANILDWQANWTSVGTAAYSEENGYFTGVLTLTAGDAALKNRQAYFWIHNDFTSAAQEWMLVSAANWVFPEYQAGCCGNALPAEWSASQVDAEVTPLWGANTATSGSGAATVATVTPTLQAEISIFRWTIESGGTDPGAGTVNQGTAYNTLGNTNLSGEDAVFNVVLPDGDSYTEAFWDTNKTWTDIFNVASGADLATIFSGGYTGNGGITSAGVVAGQGYFTLSGSTLTWTAVPEPTGALVGLLLAAVALRRRR